MVFLATDSDQSCKLILIQSVSSNSQRFHSYSRHIIGLKSFDMSCKCRLHCRATVCLWFAVDWTHEECRCCHSAISL